MMSFAFGKGTVRGYTPNLLLCKQIAYTIIPETFTFLTLEQQQISFRDNENNLV